MGQVVSLWSLNVEDRVRSQACVCEIYDAKSGIDTCFPRSTSIFPVSVSGQAVAEALSHRMTGPVFDSLRSPLKISSDNLSVRIQ